MDEVLEVHGVKVGEHRILRCNSSSVANALAALLLKIRDTTGKLPHLYLSWAEEDPFKAALSFLFLGQGEAGPTTREVLRQAEPNRERRPWVHVT